MLGPDIFNMALALRGQMNAEMRHVAFSQRSSSDDTKLPLTMLTSVWVNERPGIARTRLKGTTRVGLLTLICYDFVYHQSRSNKTPASSTDS